MTIGQTRRGEARVNFFLISIGKQLFCFFPRIVHIVFAGDMNRLRSGCSFLSNSIGILRSRLTWRNSFKCTSRLALRWCMCTARSHTKQFLFMLFTTSVCIFGSLVKAVSQWSSFTNLVNQLFLVSDVLFHCDYLWLRRNRESAIRLNENCAKIYSYSDRQLEGVRESRGHYIRRTKIERRFTLITLTLLTLIIIGFLSLLISYYRSDYDSGDKRSLIPNKVLVPFTISSPLRYLIAYAYAVIISIPSLFGSILSKCLYYYFKETIYCELDDLRCAISQVDALVSSRTEHLEPDHQMTVYANADRYYSQYNVWKDEREEVYRDLITQCFQHYRTSMELIEDFDRSFKWTAVLSYVVGYSHSTLLNFWFISTPGSVNLWVNYIVNITYNCFVLFYFGHIGEQKCEFSDCFSDAFYETKMYDVKNVKNIINDLIGYRYRLEV